MSPTPSPTPSGDPPSNPPAPPRVPDHELLRRIGKGAYGEVWLARSVTGAFRAVKIVYRQSFDHERPFEREFEGIRKAEPVSRKHDSQVDILHVGRGEDCFYYVMELADDQATGGQIHPDHYTPRTLKSDLLFHGRLAFEECVRIGVALATALEHLHKHGLVHRDVKPSNIIFVNGVAKLADIGLVTGVDATRSLVGTEGFAAPEGAGTPQADLFSLGKVLYEAATGKDRQEFPELPTQLREFPDQEGLLELNAVIARACRHDPKDRYASAAAMRADLELLQSGKSLARLHRTQERLRFVQRVGAVVSAVAALAAGLYLWQAKRTRLVGELVNEKAILVEEQSRLAEANRGRVIRLDVANGVQEMDHGNLGPALLWLTSALSLTTNNPADAALQRIRIHQLLRQHPRLVHLLPHPAAVSSAGFSPDEQRVVTACEDGRVRLWELDHDEQPRATFPFSGPVSRVQFAGNDRLLVVESDSLKHPVRAVLLDAQTGQPVFRSDGSLTCAQVSPNERWLAVARADFTIEVIAMETGRVVTKAVGHRDRVESVDFSPDSTTLITASRDRTVRQWDVATGQAIGAPLQHDYPVSQALYNADASRIATATSAGQNNDPIQFRTWNVATGAALGLPVLGQGLHSLLAFDRFGRRLLTADRESVSRVWEVDSHSAVLPPLEMDGPGRCVDFSPDGAWIAIGGDTGTVRIWDAETGVSAFSPLPGGDRVNSVRFSGDGSRLLVAGADGSARVWDLALTPADRSRQFASLEYPSVTLVADGRQLLMGVTGPNRLCLVDLSTLQTNGTFLPAATNYSGSGVLATDSSGHQWASAVGPIGFRDLREPRTQKPSTVGLWRLEQGQIRCFSLPHPTLARDVFFHRDGSRILTVGDDRASRIWNTSDGSLAQTIRWPEPDAAWIAVSPDLEVAIALSGDERAWRLVFRKVQTGELLREFPEANPNIQAVAFSPDGRRVALANGNGSARIWRVGTGEPLTPEFRHGGSLTCIQWSPDGQRVLTAGDSREVKVWDAATGSLALAPLAMKLKPVELARFSADGRFVVARCDEDFIRVWEAATGEAVTPVLPHRDTIRDVFVTAAQQLVSVQNLGDVRVWDLAQASGSAADLASYAHLLNGDAVRTADSLAPTLVSDLAPLLGALRSRQPEWFAPSPERLREYHRNQARDFDSLEGVERAIFHLERLARLAPEDTATREQLSRCRALRIPQRSPATPPQLLDLTRAYTHSFELMPHGDFADLPRGRQRLAGTEFDLRGIVELNHRAGRPGAVGPFRSEAVVEVGLRCHTLHFLQATQDDPLVEGSTVARWVVHYADGSTREWPVIYGEHLRDLWWSPPREPLEARQATVAWRGRAAIGDLPDRDGVRLFKASWANPQPDLTITQLEFRIGETSMKPLVVAITAE